MELEKRVAVQYIVMVRGTGCVWGQRMRGTEGEKRDIE